MIIIHGRYGGLCNRLLTFANLVAFAEEHGLTVLNPEFAEFASEFESFQNDPLCCYPRKARLGTPGVTWRRVLVGLIGRSARVLRRVRPGCWVNIGEKGILRLDAPNDPVVADLLSRRLSLLSGLYFIDASGMVRHADRLRALFQPAEHVRDVVARTVAAARQGADVLVGVHIRQGDYRIFADGLYFYETAEVAELMRWVPVLFPGRRVRFLVCSDTPQDAGHFAGLDVFLGAGAAMPDLYSLAVCDYLIGPPSTFTQWASFFGKAPIFTLNWKCEDHYHCPRTPLSLDHFAVNHKGFGKQ